MTARFRGLVAIVSATLGPCGANELEVTVQVQTDAAVLFPMWPHGADRVSGSGIAANYKLPDVPGDLQAFDGRTYLDLVARPYHEFSWSWGWLHPHRLNAWANSKTAVQVFLPPNSSFKLRPVIGEWGWTCSFNEWHFFWTKSCQWHETAIQYVMPLACLNQRGAKIWRAAMAVGDDLHRHRGGALTALDFGALLRAWADIQRQRGLTVLDNLVAPPVCVAEVQYFGYAIPIQCPPDAASKASQPVRIPASCVSITEVSAP